MGQGIKINDCGTRTCDTLIQLTKTFHRGTCTRWYHTRVKNDDKLLLTVRTTQVFCTYIAHGSQLVKRAYSLEPVLSLRANVFSFFWANWIATISPCNVELFKQVTLFAPTEKSFDFPVFLSVSKIAQPKGPPVLSITLYFAKSIATFIISSSEENSLSFMDSTNDLVHAGRVMVTLWRREHMAFKILHFSTRSKRKFTYSSSSFFFLWALINAITTAWNATREAVARIILFDLTIPVCRYRCWSSGDLSVLFVRHRMLMAIMAARKSELFCSKSKSAERAHGRFISMLDLEALWFQSVVSARVDDIIIFILGFDWRLECLRTSRTRAWHRPRGWVTHSMEASTQSQYWTLVAIFPVPPAEETPCRTSRFRHVRLSQERPDRDVTTCTGTSTVPFTKTNSRKIMKHGNQYRSETRWCGNPQRRNTSKDVQRYREDTSTWFL